MAISNRERIGKGLELLHAGLLPFVEAQFQKKLGADWRAVAEARFELKRQPSGELHLDNQLLLKLFMMPPVWSEFLEPVLGKGVRNYAGELLEVRNRHAHDEAFASDQTERALDTMRLLLVEVGATRQAEAVQDLRYELQRQVFNDQAKAKSRSGTLFEGSPKAGLKPWREVVTPHQDVVSGRYVQAEFAADLHNVHNGIGGSEYRDPAEFYRRTYITDGIKELLAGALERLSGRGGDPVVELQTNFGGGKTHAMLALYHLFGGTPATALPGIEPILKATGIGSAPKASRAVLVGTHLSVGETSKKPDGTKVRTLWGEMAWQLGGAEAFRLVAESDKKSTSPGADVLARLFRAHAPCLVLVDEWVAYARNTVDRRDLPSGDFESQSTFAQALTEAAKAADKTLVVTSIPSSDIEMGGPNGKYACSVLKDYVERIAKTWRPASPEEGFEIVRRRLFEPVKDKDAFAVRDAAIDAFSRMYADNKADFPGGVGEGAYKRKLEAAYPIHPDVFDLLYGEWSTLDKFQRTRGVLRLLAKVIHRLWEANDAGLLILPASVPMDDAGVKSELTRYLDDVWEPIISEDVDGPQALPLELDRANPNLSRYSACRRVARTLYMGTAPGAAGKNPGIDGRRVNLGCSQPGESTATFGDALRRVSDKAKHIHQDGSRYWISTKANLNRLADDRAAAKLQEPEVLHEEIVKRIREEHKAKANRGDFAGVHSCPDSGSEVHDEPEARLVILGPQHPHRRGQTDTAGMKFARMLLDQKGNSPRLNRNMLVFLAADEARVSDLHQGAAQYVAWKSICEEHEALNLDPAQQKQAASKFEDADKTLAARVKEAWTLALVPKHLEPASGAAKPEDLVGMDEIRIQGGDALGKRTSTKLRNDGLLVTALGGTTLRLHLDKSLWPTRDHVQYDQLCEWFARYLYLPRVVNRAVIEGAVKNGLAELHVEDTFAFAAGFDECAGRYRGLRLRAPDAIVENTSLLVKPDVARIQQEAAEAEERARKEKSGDETRGEFKLEPVEPGKGRKVIEKPVAPPKPLLPTLFVGSVRLDGARVGRDAGKIAEEVLQHLSTLSGAKVEVSLEVKIHVPAGIGDDVVRTVSENAKTLKFECAGFERE